MTDVVGTEATGPGPTDAKVVTFYSYKGGAGRTMALANVAWILAGAGRRVLVVDWDLESPGLHRYFRPFLTDRDLTSTDGVIDMLVAAERTLQRTDDLAEALPPGTDFRENIQTVSWSDFRRNGRIDFLGPGRQNIQYEANVTTFPWEWFFDDVDGNAFFATLRADLRGAGYDYVLVDSRTGVSDAAGICTKLLPDDVILCFAMNNQSIEGGARMATSIVWDAGRPIRIIPVPMRVEDGEHRKLEWRRSYARQHFRDVLEKLVGGDAEAQQQFLVNVEVPYKPYYAYEELLAAFGEPAGSRRSLLASYEELTRVITGDKRIAAGPIRLAEREQVLRQFERPEAVAPRNVMIFAAPEDRAWKDWIRTQLDRAGVVVREPAGEPQAVDDLPAVESLVLVVSPHLTPSTPGEPVVRERVSRWEAVSGIRDLGVTVVRVADGPVDEAYRHVESVSLIARGESEAHRALLGHFGLAASLADDDGMDGSAGGVRFPGRRPAVWGDVPSRNSWFVGRAAILDEVRDRLLPGGAPHAACPLIGPAGIGKGEIAREFAHRFGSDYDVVWWVEATDAETTRRSLAQLSERLLQRSGDTAADQSRGTRDEAAVALEALRRGEPWRRWLLIYHNAVEPSALAGLVPDLTSFGHVLVTTRDAAWADTARPVRVEALSRAESMEYLRRRLPAAEEEGLDAVADAVADMPIHLHLAGGWLSQSGLEMSSAIADYVAQLRERTPGAGLPNVGAWTGFAFLKKAADPVQRAAARLLELCAFLSPDGAAMTLVSSPAMLRQLAADIGHEPPVERDQLPRLLQLIQRYSLVEIDQGRGLIRMPQLTRQIVREAMTDEEQETTRLAAVGVLASHAPETREAGELRNRPIYAELQKHIYASRAFDSRARNVREWLVHQLRFLWQTGQWETAKVLGEECLHRWRKAEGIGPDDPLTLRAATHLANSLRSLGLFVEAFELDEDTLARQRRNIGIHHPHTLLTAGGLGADKRALGWFRDAFAEDQATWLGFRQLLDDDHPATLNAANNLALSVQLTGDVAGALRLNREVFELRRRVLGPGDSATWWSQCRIGICRCELGEYEEAHRLLTEAAEGLTAAAGPTNHFTLRARKQQAVALLRLDDAKAAARRLAEDTLSDLARYYGDRDFATTACRLTLAAALHALGSDAEAVALATRCLRLYEDIYGDDHPVTGACRTNLSVYLRAAGDPRRALGMAEKAHGVLLDLLYESHPYTLAAAINHANALVAVGASAVEVRERDEETYAECQAALGEEHPYTITARENRNEADARVTGVAGGQWRDVEIDVLAL
jgi:tetratricopeptide (TPR) repeat protein